MGQGFSKSPAGTVFFMPKHLSDDFLIQLSRFLDAGKRYPWEKTQIFWYLEKHVCPVESYHAGLELAVCLHSPLFYELFESRDYVSCSPLSRAHLVSTGLLHEWMASLQSSTCMHQISYRTLHQGIRKELLVLRGWRSGFMARKAVTAPLWSATCTARFPSGRSTFILLVLSTTHRADLRDALYFEVWN